MSETTTKDAGRELDALIAEKVMGWGRQFGSFAGTAEWHEDAVQLVSPEYAYPLRPTTMPITYYDGFPHYSTDIAAAWQVVVKMGERGYHARVQSPFIPGDEFHAGFTPHGSSGWNGRPDFAASADSAPLAICRAALLAVEAPAHV